MPAYTIKHSDTFNVGPIFSPMSRQISYVNLNHHIHENENKNILCQFMSPNI